MSDTHAASRSYIKALEPPVGPYDRNESNIVGEHIDVIGRRHSNSDFELLRKISRLYSEM